MRLLLMILLAAALLTACSATKTTVPERVLKRYEAFCAGMGMQAQPFVKHFQHQPSALIFMCVRPEETQS